MSQIGSYRRPQAFDPDDPSIAPTPETTDAADRQDGPTRDDMAAEDAARPPMARDSEAARPRRRLLGPWGSLLVASATGLFSLAAGLWFANFVSIALAREDWLGLLANGLLALLALSVIAIVVRELIGLWRLGRLTRIRADAEAAIQTQDQAAEARAVTGLKRLVAGRREHAWALARFREEERHMRAPGQLLALADRVLMAPADAEARRIVFQSARRVGIATAMVPIAFLSMLFVLSEILRMIRRLATAYGGRPGVLGGMKLFSGVLAHMAATGAIVLTDDLIGQFFGQDLAHRLSRRLGEGAFNAALTARLGIAAIEVCRPMPYVAAPRIRARQILTQLFPELKPGALIRATLRGRRAGTGAPSRRDAAGPETDAGV